MILADDVMNTEVSVAFFTAMFAALGTIVVALINARHKVEELKSVTIQAAESAEAAQANTANVSNGFVNRMDRKLDTIITSQDGLERTLREHLAWHLDREA